MNISFKKDIFNATCIECSKLQMTTEQRNKYENERRECYCTGASFRNERIDCVCLVKN